MIASFIPGWNKSSHEWIQKAVFEELQELFFAVPPPYIHIFQYSHWVFQLYKMALPSPPKFGQISQARMMQEELGAKISDCLHISSVYSYSQDPPPHCAVGAPGSPECEEEQRPCLEPLLLPSGLSVSAIRWDRRPLLRTPQRPLTILWRHCQHAPAHTPSFLLHRHLEMCLTF